MRLSFIEYVVLSLILACSLISFCHSLINYVAPLSIEDQRARMEPRLDMHRAFGLADARGFK